MTTTTIEPAPAKRKPLHKVVLRLFLASALFWIPMLIFVGLANEIKDGDSLPGDVAILQAIHGLNSPFLDMLARIVTELGGVIIVSLAVAVAVTVLYVKRHRRPAVFLLFSAAGTALLNVVFKLFFQRERPDLWQHLVTEHSYSFPSGHSMISSALAFGVIVLCWQTRYRWLAVAAGGLYFVLVGLSRMYLGVHFPSDVVGGWCVSFLWIAVLTYVFARFGRGHPTKSTSSRV